MTFTPAFSSDASKGYILFLPVAANAVPMHHAGVEQRTRAADGLAVHRHFDAAFVRDCRRSPAAALLCLSAPLQGRTSASRRRLAVKRRLGVVPIFAPIALANDKVHVMGEFTWIEII